MNNIESIDVLDEIIVGWVTPHIYAFSTNTIPSYLKIGDTYIPVSHRLKEWQEVFPNLEKQYEKEAIINKDFYFRDYEIINISGVDSNRKYKKAKYVKTR